MVESATCQDNVVATSCKKRMLLHAVGAALTDAHATMALDIAHRTHGTFDLDNGTSDTGTRDSWKSCHYTFCLPDGSGGNSHN